MSTSTLARPDRRCQPGFMAPRRWDIGLAAAGMVVAVPVATWWVVGDLSTVPASVGGDYLAKPVNIGHGAESAAGIASTVLAAIALVMLVRSARKGRIGSPWLTGVLSPLVVGGV